jgi:hypothetical protein
MLVSVYIILFVENICICCSDKSSCWSFVCIAPLAMITFTKATTDIAIATVITVSATPIITFMHNK